MAISKENELQEAEKMIELLRSCNNSVHIRHILNKYNDKLWDKLANKEELSELEHNFLTEKYHQEEAEAGLL